MAEQEKIAVIIGAGPAGLTAAYELLTRTDYIPVVLEASDMVGGISRTVVYKGNRMDIGGHRFFSKSDRVMNWWLSFLPLEKSDSGRDVSIRYHRMDKTLNMDDSGPDPTQENRVMLVRSRLSRIFYLRRFFDYPIRLNTKTIRNLGVIRTVAIGLSYFYARLFPIRQEKSLEDFFINRFGRVLYRTFFKDYTEKVWGVPCHQIKPEWGAQRIKGLSVSKAVWHALRSILPREQSVEQKEVETSLIDRFLYPKLGPGQLWEAVADKVRELGGTILMNEEVSGLELDGARIVSVLSREVSGGTENRRSADLVFSTMPVKELISCFHPPAPEPIRKLASELIYRDFIAVGVLLKRMNTPDTPGTDRPFVPDNWIYVQDADVQVGRIQVFNNWSPYLVQNQNQVWLGMEYFCNEGDGVWEMKDPDLLTLAVRELVKIGLANREDYLDGVVVRMKKTYPAYFGSYDQFDQIREYTDQLTNLYLIGRNGMHKYNNQDHSMLTAMTAVDNIAAGNLSARDNIWSVNTEEDYHEEKS